VKVSRNSLLDVLRLNHHIAFSGKLCYTIHSGRGAGGQGKGLDAGLPGLLLGRGRVVLAGLPGIFFLAAPFAAAQLKLFRKLQLD
jgi:hypothetical protein